MDFWNDYMIRKLQEYFEGKPHVIRE
jgi:hypothetical protein